MRRPARKAAVRNSGTSVKAVPRSGSAAMRRAMRPTAAPGAAMSRRPRLSFLYSAKILATSRQATSLANSEGWIWKPPGPITQRRVPAMRGAKTST